MSLSVRPVSKRPHAMSFSKPSRTKQSFREECDINKLMARYAKIGVSPFLPPDFSKFGDFTNPPEYQDALNRVISANQMFEALPARIRERFLNDPAKFLAFVSDPKNTDEARVLGILNPSPPAEPPLPPDGGEGNS